MERIRQSSDGGKKRGVSAVEQTCFQGLGHVIMGQKERE